MIYPYEWCCGQKRDRHCSLAEYEANPEFHCIECGRLLTRIITAPRFLNNTKPFEAFRSPVDGSVITCERELREHNKRNNVVNIHEGYDQKSIESFAKKDFQKPLDEERSASLRADMAEAIEKLDQGYKPQVANEGDAP